MTKKKRKRGPKPKPVKINDENWENAVKTDIQRKNPKTAGPQKLKRDLNKRQINNLLPITLFALSIKKRIFLLFLLDFY
jgi:hypothetical protein